MSTLRRIIFVQFTNPAAYPPLEHSSRILADRGWKVTFLGTGSMGEADGFCLPLHSNIEVKRWSFRTPGLSQKLQYVAFCLWVVEQARRSRAAWIYASDSHACPSALLAARLLRCRVIYHEHDSPSGLSAELSVFQRVVLRSRRLLAHVAEACVLPNAARIEVFQRETGTTRPVLCVWNCPERREVTEVIRADREETVIFYHGSLNAARLPFTVLHAMAELPKRLSLQFAGYSTTGHSEFVSEFLAEANRLGLGRRVRYLGASATRETLLRFCRQASVGAAFMPVQSDDINMRAMSGASNKPFDYLASGLPVLVSNLPDWQQLFVEPGYGLSCNPAEAASVAGALRWFVEHTQQARRMAETGRERVLREWNYETQFAPVLELMEHGADAPSDRR